MILRLTKSKKGVLVIDDDGRTYITSVAFLIGLTEGKAPGNMMTCKRLEHDTSPQRFGRSRTTEGLKPSEDIFAQRAKEQKEEGRGNYEDIKVW